MTFFQIYSVAVAFLFLFLAWRTRRFTRHLAKMTDVRARSPETEGVWPKVSVVVPACNEADTIEAALDSLLNVDYPSLEVILVDDRSTDSTGEIIDRMAARDSRIRAVHVNRLPEGWLGKVHAMHTGLEMASADWVLFTDADVHFATDALKNAMAHCMREKIDFMTAVPDVVARSQALQIVIAQLFHQASLFFKPHKINNPSHRACYGQGAFMLFKYSVYKKSETLEWLKMEVVDDTGLALLMRRAGARMAALSGRNQIQIEWYPSLPAFLRGIEKNAFAFSQYSLAVLFAFTAVTWVVFAGFAVAPILSGTWWAPALSLVAIVLYLRSTHKQLSQLMKIRPWTTATFPLAFVVLPMLFLRASLLTKKRGGINWRGTFYSLENLKANQRMKLANLVFAGENEKAPEVSSPEPVLSRTS